MLEYHIDISQLGFYVYLGPKIQDVLVISNEMGESSSQVKVSLNPESPDKLVIIVQTTDKSCKVGSVSIPQDLFFFSGQSRHLQWITLFDHLEDDEYDGDFTEEDEEMPRIQLMFNIHNYQHSNTTPVTRVSNPLQQPNGV